MFHGNARAPSRQRIRRRRLAAATADARQITLAWEASPDASVTGYMVSYGTQPGIYTTHVDVGNLVSWQVDLPGNQYYVAVRAYDAGGRFSAYSLEVGDAASAALESSVRAPVSDTAGAMDLQQGWVWINATFASTLANSCLASYTRATNTVSLMDDAGATGMTATLGSSGTLQNSPCAIALGSSTTAAERKHADGHTRADAEAGLQRREERLHVCAERKRDQRRLANARHVDCALIAHARISASA
jgi:hypothetical protein